MVVLVVTLGLVAGACAGLPNLEVDFNYDWFLPPDSYAKTTNDIKNDYFSTGGGLPYFVYTKEGNYGTAHQDGSLAAMYGRVRSCKWTAREIYNWYESFVEDVGRSDRAKVSESAFVEELSQFVASPAGARFAPDIIFTVQGQNAVSIKGTRVFYLGMPTKNGGDDIEFVKALRESTDSKPLEAFPFFNVFLYFDGYALMLDETIRNVVIALVCVLFVTAALLGDIVASLLVVSMVGIVDICLLGYMAHWDLDFNSVTAINVTIAVGLAVDYSAHVAHSFLVAVGDRKERAMDAIDHIGPSVANGAFSTFLAVVPLGASNSYVFTVFFKMWLMIILFGAYMGLILLPVVLRWVGPQSYGAKDSSTEEMPKEIEIHVRKDEQ
jgi:predicted RND superfamily exporter protein